MKPGEKHDDAPAQASSVDPVVSMSLLTAPLANPLNTGYEHYQTDHGSWFVGLVSCITVFAVTTALGFGSAIAIDSLRRPASDMRAGLKERTATRSSNAEALNDELQSLGRVIDDLSQSGSPIPVDSARDPVTVTRPISGPGIIVVLTDRSGPGKGSGVVRDRDVVMVANALRVAGAEAIPVNGQCIGLDTFVCTAGAAILVNVIPMSSPCEVMTIGGSNTLSAVLARGAAGGYLSAAQSVNGMTVSSKVSQSLSMEALAPSSPQYAQPLDTQPEGGIQQSPSSD